MLKGVPNVLSPQLISTIMKMGHGDEICIADGNFPAESTNSNCIRADGISGPQILEAIMQFFPLDTYAEPVILMEPVPGDKSKFPGGKPPIWKTYSDIINKAESRDIPLTQIDRFAFYERAKKSYAVVATSESAIYANIILKKGVITTAKI